MLKQRDIVLIPIPFTDLTSQKKRPAAILSSDTYNKSNEDIVVAAVTSNIESRPFSVMLTGDDLESGTLKVVSIIRADKIYTLNKSIVIKTFGSVKYDIFFKLKSEICKLIKTPEDN